MSPSAGESVNIVANEIIKVTTADTRKYSSNNKQTLKQKEQTKLPQKERKRETGELAKKQQLTTPIQGEKGKKKRKKPLKKNLQEK